MKKSDVSKRILLALVLGCFVALPSTVGAADKYGAQGYAIGGHVTIGDGESWDNVYGGYSTSGRVDSNKVTVSGTANITGKLYGGWGSEVKVLNNIVDVKNGTFEGKVVGGFSENRAELNSVKIQGGTFAERVIGGESGAGVAEKNTVTIDGGSLGKAVYGGLGQNGVTGNDIKMTAGTVKDMYGGYSVTSLANYNDVVILGGTVIGTVYGGHAKVDNAEKNSVTISGNAISKAIYGGFSENKNATENTVSIQGGTVKGYVYGGYAFNAGEAKGNSVTMSEGSTIESGGALFGAFSGRGLVENNTVSIQGGTLEGNAWGGSNIEGETRLNKVIITGGTVEGKLSGGSSTNKLVTKNSVTLEGGTVIGDVYGGYSYGTGNVTSNTVIIGGSGGPSVDLSKAALYGGYSKQGSVSDNSLEVYTKGNKVKQLANFANLNFYIPSDMETGDKMVTVVGGEITTVANAKVTGFVPGDTVLAKGDQIVLLNNETGIITNGNTYKGEVAEGISLTHKAIVKKLDAKNIVLILQDANAPEEPLGEEPNPTPGSGDNGGNNGGNDNGGNNGGNDNGGNNGGNDNGGNNGGNDNGGNNGGNSNTGLLPHTKSLVETTAAAAAFLNQGADLLAGAGMGQAEMAAKAGNGSWEGFAATGGNSLKVKTGSHVDIDGYSLGVGIAKITPNKHGKLMVGPVFEYGNGSYDSYLDDGTHGEGDTRYVGGGVLLRQENHNGSYYEGSVRAGRMNVDYKSSDVGTAYDTSSTYVGGHLGLGMVKELATGNELEYYGKFFYSHTGGSTATLATGETYRFDSVNSERVRLGARYTHGLNEKSKLYTGLAWEYEFGGDAKAHYKGYTTASPSLSGSSGLVELGLQVLPSGKDGMNVDFNVTGWMGKQKGVTFRAGANWSF